MVNMENYEEYMLLEADGELTEAEQKALHLFMDQHPELKHELDLYRAVKLEPDTTLVYEAKEELLKTAPGPGKRTINLGGWWTYGAVAASIALAVLLFKKPATDETTGNNTIAHTAQPETIKQPETTDTQAKQPAQELHSTPTGPVAIENQPTTPPKAIAKTKKIKTTESTQTPVPQPQVAANEPAPIHKQPVTNNPAEPIKEKKVEEYAQVPAMPQPSQPEPILTAEEKNNLKMLALAPVQSKFEGFPDIKEAVAGKIEKVKNLKERIKDTDIQVRFGNAEFTVKL